MRGWTGKNKAFCSPGTQNVRCVIKVYRTITSQYQMHQYPSIHLGEERHCEGKMPKNITQGLECRPLDLEVSTTSLLPHHLASGEISFLTKWQILATKKHHEVLYQNAIRRKLHILYIYVQKDQGSVANSLWDLCAGYLKLDICFNEYSYPATASQRGDTWQKNVSLWTVTSTRQFWNNNTKNEIREGEGQYSTKVIT